MKVRHFHRSAASALVVGGLLMVVPSAAAQVASPTATADQPTETLRLTLDDAVRRAVENNPELAIVRLGTEVEAARVGETRSAFTPLFSTTLGRSSIATPSSNLLTGESRRRR